LNLYCQYQPCRILPALADAAFSFLPAFVFSGSVADFSGAKNTILVRVLVRALWGFAFFHRVHTSRKKTSQEFTILSPKAVLSH
jgi:hypothetical protein